MSIKRKQDLCLDTIESCLSMACITREHVLKLCDPRGADDALDNKDEMLLNAWSFIDVVKRLRSVLQNTPGLKRGKIMEEFLAETERVTYFRNHIQHIEEKMMDVAATGQPILGSCSWCESIENGKQFKVNLFVPGRLTKTSNIPLVNPLGRVFHGKLDHFSMTVGDETININEMSRAVEAFGQRFEAAKNAATTKTVSTGETIMLIDLDSVPAVEAV